MEVGVFTDVPIDHPHIRVVGIIRNHHVHFDRPYGFVWKLAFAEGAEYGLAPDHDEVRPLHNHACGAENVLQLLAIHATRCFQYRSKASSTAWRCLLSSAPGNGEF